MTRDSLMTRARGLWEHLAGESVVFPPDGGVGIVASSRSRLCPALWAGVVRVGDAAIVTAPDEDQAQLLRGAVAGVALDSLVEADALRELLPVVEVLGPATLGYLSSDGFRPAFARVAVTCLASGHDALRALAKVAGPDDAGESGIGGIDSPVFVMRDGAAVTAAAGYEIWPASTAHLCVLTAPGYRGRGLARQVASAAVAHALDAGLLPQWRAGSETSRGVAAALGFQQVGGQLSVRLHLDGWASH